MVLLKYPFYYIIRSGFGKFFGKIHVLTHHLAPELDRFRFCLGFWSMLHFGRKLDIFGDVLTQGHNWLRWRIRRRARTRKMEPKGARRSPGRPAWSL